MKLQFQPNKIFLIHVCPKPYTKKFICCLFDMLIAHLIVSFAKPGNSVLKGQEKMESLLVT